MNIFLLEDDEAIGIGLKYSLENEGYTITLARSVKQAESIIDKETFSLYILDINLPDGSGYDICRKVKEKGDFPVIFLTAYDDEVNVVMGLDIGADDYITKPFRVRELVARIKSILRRCGKDKTESVVKLGNVSVNLNEARVTKGGDDVILTAMEYRLLLTFLNNRGKILSRSRLLEEIWDVDGDFVNDNTLTVYIKRLRDKIERDPAYPSIIKTVRGLGYVIENER